MDKLMTPNELANELSVPISWIYSRTRQKGSNAIPVIRAGKYCRFDLQEVLGWLKKQQDAEVE